MNAGNPEARIVSSAPVSTGAVVWRSRGQLYVTVVVKATFALVNEHAMELTEPIELFRSELHHRQNPSRSVRATSDMAPYLNRADVVLTGHAFAPSGAPQAMVPVRLALFREQAILDKTVHVYGDRKSGSPAPFEKIPLMYERALGGVGFDENPMGIGMQAGGAHDLHAANIEHPTDPTKVAGFGPISRTWPARRRLLGKMDRKALDKPIIALPDGFDWSYFQAAPADQQIEFLRGDEWVVLEGIHPDVPRISSRLPSTRVTGKVAGLGDAGQVRGLDFHADILRIDADQQSCSVVWRSSMPVADEAAIEALTIHVGLELGGQAIEWSQETGEEEIDSLDTMDVDESAFIDESALVDDGAPVDESDFAKTVPREDKAPAPRPEKTTLWTPEMAAALRAAPPDLNASPADVELRAALAKRTTGDLDDATTDTDTRKLKPKAEDVSQEGTLKLAPVKEAFVRHASAEEAPQPTQKLTLEQIARGAGRDSETDAPRPPLETIAQPDARPPLETIAQPDARPPLETIALPDARAPLETIALIDASELQKSGLPFSPAQREGAPTLPKPGPKRFDGTFALSMDDQAQAGHKAAVPFAPRAPAAAPRPSPGARAAIPGAPWAPKNKPQAPPRPPKPRFDQTVTAIGDAPSRAQAATPVLATPTLQPSTAVTTPTLQPIAEAATPVVPSALTDVAPPLPPPIAPPPRPKLPPLKPTLPRGTPAPRLAATRETGVLKSLESIAKRAGRTQDAVPVVHKTPFTVLSFPWQLKARTDSLVVVVKATCDLAADGPARLRPQADPASGDLHEGGDSARTLLYTTDFAVFKPRADVTLSGHAYAPSGSSPAAQARLRFGGKTGGFDRRIAVFGERRWQKAGIKLAPSEARPFKKVPLVWERAFGGPAFEKNPSGVGMDGDLLPQLEDPASLVRSPSDTPEPACFAGVPPRWAARRGALGTFDAEWKKNRWPYFPDDFDWAYFQAAPASQQVEHPNGDESFELAGVSAEHPVIRGKLPGVRPRCFAQKTGDAAGDFHEVLLRLDTIAFEPDAMKVTLVWRGAIDVADDTAEDVAELFVIEEPVAGPPIDRAEALSKYRAAKLPPAPEEITETDAANDTQPGNAPEPLPIAPLSAEEAAKVRADVEAWLAEGASLEGRDLAGADLSELDFSGRSLRGAQLARSKLARCKLGRASLAGAQMEDADLAGADLAGADLAGADLTRADLSGADLSGAKIGGAIFADARADKSRWREATGDSASFAGASLNDARFDRAALGSADFTRATLDGAVLDGATLLEVRLYDAQATGASWNGAKLDGARADGVILRRCSLQRVQARSSVWDRAVLDESTFLGAVLAESGLAKASCRGTIFSGADLSGSRLRRGSFQGASFLKANLMTASLEGAELDGADLRGANLHGAETHRAKLGGAKLDLAIVTQTKLAGTPGTT